MQTKKKGSQNQTTIKPPAKTLPFVSRIQGVTTIPASLCTCFSTRFDLARVRQKNMGQLKRIDRSVKEEKHNAG